MIDPFDYKEPACPLSGGKEFYYPSENTPMGSIPFGRILEKVNACFDKNDYQEAGRLLEHWQREAVELKDERGELALVNELLGFYRKTNDKPKAYKTIDRALMLISKLGQADLVTGGTVLLNVATVCKAFGDSDKALAYYEKAQEIYTSALSLDDERFGGLYNNKALALVDLERYDEAIVYYMKAVKVMEGVENGELDVAITYVNLAHLYKSLGEEKKVTDSLFIAYGLINKPSIPRNGYYAYVCEKCAPSFGYFGYKIIENTLLKVAKDIYERN